MAAKALMLKAPMENSFAHSLVLLIPWLIVSGACVNGGTAEDTNTGGQAHGGNLAMTNGGAPSAGSAGALAKGGTSNTSGGALNASGGTASAGSASAAGAGGSAGGGAGSAPYNTSSKFAKLVPEPMFEAMFPERGSFYTYASLIEAADLFPDFASDGSDAAKREAAAFLANVERETLGLVYADEIIKGPYCAPSPDCPCAEGKSYWGRGALQLSWNYNYCAAGQALGLPLRTNPEMVSAEPLLAWRTALWFWMSQTSGTSHTPHQAISDTGFGETIRIINGGIECNGPTDPGVQAAVQERKDHYLSYTTLLGVGVGGSIDC